VTVRDVAPLLPSIAGLRDHCRAMAVLEAVLSPRWESRYHSFDGAWSDGVELASMRNGSGDEYSLVLTAAGAYLRGFDHESPMSPYAEDHEAWPGVLDDVPEAFRCWVAEPAFTDETGVPVVTACLWRETGDDGWRHGAVEFPEGRSDPDGADYLFGMLVDRSPENFRDWARDYYGVPVDLAVVRHVFGGGALTEEVVRSLNPQVTLAALADDLTAIG
jgi:hypothetical protein